MIHYIPAFRDGGSYRNLNSSHLGPIAIILLDAAAFPAALFPLSGSIVDIVPN